MAETMFRRAINLLAEVGVFDVLLPFLLVFTIMFAIFDKTKVFGSENGASKKNINAIASFAAAFLVVGSAQLVKTINEAMANVVILVFLGVSFLILTGTLSGKDKAEGGWLTFFKLFMGVAVLMVFAHALGWLQVFWDWVLSAPTDPEIITSVVFLIIIVGFMWFIVSPSGESKSKPEVKEEEKQ